VITKETNQLVVEGFVAAHPGRGECDRVPRRIEIDERTGLIQAVGETHGTGDLILGERFTILPGLVDIHVHAREDATSSESYKEDFRSAGEAAIHGGVTAFADMPNNRRPPVDDASYGEKRDLARSCPVDVLLYAGIGPRTRPLSFPAPYKAYMGPSVGDLFFDSEDALRQALARYRGLQVSFHAESPEVLHQHQHAPTHAERRPPSAEARAIETALEIAESFQIEPHICHLSTAEGLEIIRRARRRGAHATCEVAPHHLYYDLDNVSAFSQPSFLQVNPPLRSRLDRIALLEAFRAGEIDCLATDHAPHTLEENEAGVSGMPHLDTCGPFLFWLMDQGISLSTILGAAAERPGKFISRYLPGRHGKIEKGCVGSLTVLETRPITVRRGSLRTRAGWSPFEGVTFPGRVSHTVVRGKVYPHVEE
jgi:dihydroorotase